MFRHAFAALCLVPAVMSIAPAAQADEPPQLPPSAATAPPPGYGQPPPGYGQPPPGYYPPPGYGPQYYQPQGDQRPIYLDYEEDQPIPAGYHLRTKVRGGLIGGGAGMLGGMWVLSVIIGAVGNAGHDRGLGGDGSEPWTPMFFPVVGPFITMGTASSDLSSGGAAMLALDGVAQVGGAAMIVLGIALPKKQLVRDEVGGGGITVQPVFTGCGMALTGTF